MWTSLFLLLVSHQTFPHLRTLICLKTTQKFHITFQWGISRNSIPHLLKGLNFFLSKTKPTCLEAEVKMFRLNHTFCKSNKNLMNGLNFWMRKACRGISSHRCKLKIQFMSLEGNRDLSRMKEKYLNANELS